MPTYQKMICGFIAFMTVFYGYQYFTRPIKGVEDDVRPYLEDCLDLIINKEFDEIYAHYFVGEKQISVEEFNDRMKYLEIIFGEPISYDYSRSYIGGVGYFIQYQMNFSNHKQYTCSFSFPITEGKEIVEKEDLERLTISGDYGERSFQIQFDTGRAFGHKKGGISVGYDKKDSKPIQ